MELTEEQKRLCDKVALKAIDVLGETIARDVAQLTILTVMKDGKLHDPIFTSRAVMTCISNLVMEGKLIIREVSI